MRVAAREVRVVGVDLQGGREWWRGSAQVEVEER